MTRVFAMKVGSGDMDTTEVLFCCGDKEKRFVEERPHEKWEYLKEHITEMRDADGELNQKDTCKFILELMGVIEREGETE